MPAVDFRHIPLNRIKPMFDLPRFGKRTVHLTKHRIRILFLQFPSGETLRIGVMLRNQIPLRRSLNPVDRSGFAHGAGTGIDQTADRIHFHRGVGQILFLRISGNFLSRHIERHGGVFLRFRRFRFRLAADQSGSGESGEKCDHVLFHFNVSLSILFGVISEKLRRARRESVKRVQPKRRQSCFSVPGQV